MDFCLHTNALVKSVISNPSKNQVLSPVGTTPQAYEDWGFFVGAPFSKAFYGYRPGPGELLLFFFFPD
jgi:hypothetical protein